MSKSDIFAIVCIFLVCFAAYFCLIGVIFMFLWNYVAVGIFSAPVIGFNMSVAAVFLLTMIGGFFKINA